MSKIFINTDKITDIEELENSLIKNEKIASRIKNEIKKLSERKLLNKSTNIIEPIIKLTEKIEQQEIEYSEYAYYYDEINEANIDLTDDELKQLIRDNLPSKEHINYFKIVSRIKAEIYKDLMAFDELSKDATDDLELLKEIKIYVNFLAKKFNFINEIEKEKLNDKKEKRENNIVFLETNSGNIYAFSDLESIDREYYESFKELYNSIKNGTFKNAKRFTSTNQKNRTLCEVKGFKTRIIFERLNKNTYMILQLLVKKCDIDKLYNETVIKRFTIYKNNQESILNSLNDENYINKNKQLCKNFENLLSEKNKKGEYK